MNAEMKKAMRIPPIPQAPTRDRSHRSRNRIRVEVPPEQANWLLEIVVERIKALTVDDEAFAAAFGLYRNIKLQLDKLHKGKVAATKI